MECGSLLPLFNAQAWLAQSKAQIWEGLGETKKEKREKEK